MADGKQHLLGELPGWATGAIRAGGWTAAVAVVWFGIAVPMREDFKDFRTAITSDLKEVKGELKTLNDTVLSGFRERVTRIESRCDDNARRIEALEKKG